MIPLIQIFSVTNDAVEVVASLKNFDSDLWTVSTGGNTEDVLDLGDIDNYNIVNSIHSQFIKTAFSGVDRIYPC